MRAGKKTPRKRVLISGFEAFGGESLNPTQLLVESVSRGDIAVPTSMDVKAVLLPVVFGEGATKLLNEMREFQSDIVLAFGQAGGRPAFQFERVAINFIDGEQADNSGVVHRDVSIVPGAPSALFSTLPIRNLAEHLIASGVPAKISNSAGLFVCNDLFFRLQLATLRSLTLSGFIHVPYLEEQAKGRNVPFMSSEMMKKGVELILAYLAKDSTLSLKS